MFYDYVITKPELNEETLSHYGIPGMKWKNHIYAKDDDEIVKRKRKFITEAAERKKKAITESAAKRQEAVNKIVPSLANKVSKSEEKKETNNKNKTDSETVFGMSRDEFAKRYKEWKESQKETEDSEEKKASEDGESEGKEKKTDSEKGEKKSSSGKGPKSAINRSSGSGKSSGGSSGSAKSKSNTSSESSGSSVKTQSYKKGDSDFDKKNYSEKNRIGKSNFFCFTNAKGKLIVLSEDNKWVVENGVLDKDMRDKLADFNKDGKLKGDDFDKGVESILSGTKKKKK